MYNAGLSLKNAIYSLGQKKHQTLKELNHPLLLLQILKKLQRLRHA